jgi:hypothetical protein
VPSSPIPGGRRCKRIVTKKQGHVVINSEGKQATLPCVVVDTSPEGVRLRGNFRLKPGQLVEIIVDDKPAEAKRCEVKWISKAGQESEAGLLTPRATQEGAKLPRSNNSP